MKRWKLIMYSIGLFSISLFNIACQLLILTSSILLNTVIFDQSCTLIFVYSIGVVANSILMVTSALTALISYILWRSKRDHLLLLVLFHTIVWIAFGLISYFAKKFECRSEQYPFWLTIVALSINLVLGGITTIIGIRIARKLAKSYKEAKEENTIGCQYHYCEDIVNLECPMDTDPLRGSFSSNSSPFQATSREFSRPEGDDCLYMGARRLSNEVDNRESKSNYVSSVNSIEIIHHYSEPIVRNNKYWLN